VPILCLIGSGGARLAIAPGASVAPPIAAGIAAPHELFRFVPIRDLSTCSNVDLLDHLIGAGDQRGRDGETHSFGRLEVNDEFKFRGLLYG
jgi:hypothetical protein